MPRRVPPAAWAALFAAFLLTRAAFFALTTAGEYALYQRYGDAARATSLADLYRTTDVEYPPFAVLLGVVAGHVADALPDGVEVLVAWRPTDRPDVAGRRFEVGLGIVLFAVDLASLALVYAIARRAYPDEGPVARAARLAVYVAGTSAGGLILYDRQDPVVGLFALLALAAFARGWAAAAYAVLSAGCAYKLVPVLLVPLFVLAAAAARSAPAATTRSFLAAAAREAAVAGLFLLAYPVLSLLLLGDRSFLYLSFHSARGLQLEAPVSWLVFLADPGTAVGYGYGGHDLRGDLADRAAKAAAVVAAAAAALTVLVVGRGFRRAAGAPRPPGRDGLVAHLAAGSLLMWLGFILFNKVGSPQFLLWLAPLVPLLPLRGSDRWLAAVLLAAMAVTAMIYPGQYEQVRGELTTDDPRTWSGPTAVGLALLVAKSVTLAVAFVWLTVLVWRSRPCSRPGVETPGHPRGGSRCSP
ncbi:MAG: hypothetical protein C0501_24740 [Isosphaera sp.]|nr:hypothetical protein [Isosphaera sp.]